MSVENDADMTREEGIETVYDGPSHVVILGAGASIASTIHNPEPSGKKLPSMDNFIDVVGLKEILDSADGDCQPGNFEEIYSCLYTKDPDSRTILGIGQKVFDYFSDLRLPDTPTIYDYLLLALRPKDLIATFNWDPFLFQAFVRNRRFTDALQRLSFLHGNVAVGYSEKDQRAGPVGMRSRATGDEFVQTPLLYPVTHKDYNKSEFITQEWGRLQAWLEKARRFTIFGYGAPVTDVEAVDLMSNAWGGSSQRNMEQIEIIDIQPRETLVDRWERFIHTHHYECFSSYFQSSLAFFPRRTGERFMHQFVAVTPGEVFQEPNQVPQRFETLEALWEWHTPLLDAENRKIASMPRNTPLDEAEIKSLGSYGAGLLTMFHEEYAKNPTGRETEFRRGHVAEWRHLLAFIYGPHTTERIVDAALEEPNVSWEWDASRWLAPGKRIIGRLGKSGDAGYVLLHELLRTDFPLGDEPARQSYEAGFCFEHDHAFPANFALDRFSAVRIDLEGLEEWLRLEAIDLGEEVRRGNQVEFTVRYDRVEIDYDTPRGKVSIENIVLGNLPFRLFHSLVASAHIRQTNWLVYEPKETLDLAQLQTSFRRIEEVIALLLGQYFRLDWPKLVAKFGEFDDWFTLYWKRGPRHETAPSVYFMMTTFPPIREDFGKMLDRWETRATKYGAGYDLYMASMQQPLPYAEHQFVNLVWAIESLHRGRQRDAGESSKVARRKKRIEEILSREWLAGKLKYAYEPTLGNRIVESFARLPFELDPLTLRAFAERCARRRNDISHEGGSRPGEDAESFRAELRTLVEALRHLFHALLLHEIGLSQDLLLKALTRGGIGSMSIVPALRAVGIELPVTPEEKA